MAKILLGFSIAFMLAAATLGFLAKGKIDVLQSTLKATKDTLFRTENTLKTTKADLEKRTEELTAANTKIEGLDKEIARQKGEMDSLNTKLTEATTALEAKTKEIADIQTKLNEMSTQPGGLKPEEVAAKINELTGRAAKAEAEVAELKQVQDTLNARVKEAEDKFAVANQEVRRYKLGVQRQGLTGRVLAVNRNWGFVVLDVGDKQGAMVNTPMLVTRNGAMVGKVKITAVEPNTSIADVIPGSTPRGQDLQPGDTVVFEGRATAATP